MILAYGRTEWTVEKLDEPDGIGLAYMLTGVRGAKYGLMRNTNSPTMLFAINARKFTGTTPFEWVREHPDGTLEVVR